MSRGDLPFIDKVSNKTISEIDSNDLLPED
jgi:hypothetical protein